jgi:hypothetical protein
VFDLPVPFRLLSSQIPIHGSPIHTLLCRGFCGPWEGGTLHSVACTSESSESMHVKGVKVTKITLGHPLTTV